MDKNEVKPIIEAILIASDRPLSLDDIVKITKQGNQRVAKDTLKQALDELMNECRNHSYELKEVASGYRYQTRTEYSEWIAKLWEQKPPRYSRAALEILALIAYRQPITRAGIEEVRGVAVSSNTIRMFEDRDWIKVIGHKETPGRPALYATTDKFLDDFNLTSLSELPELSELSQQEEALPQLQLAVDNDTEIASPKEQ